MTEKQVRNKKEGRGKRKKGRHRGREIKKQETGTDRQTAYIQTNRQTDRQTDRQKKQTGKQTVSPNLNTLITLTLFLSVLFLQRLSSS